MSYSHELGVQRQIVLVPHRRFLYQTLCVFSQMKDTKHINRDFHSVAWVLSQGWDFWALGVPGGQFLFKHDHVGVRSKCQISFNFDYHVISKISMQNFECVLTNKR